MLKSNTRILLLLGSKSEFAAPLEKSAYIDDSFESFSMPDIFERLLIVGAGVTELLLAFDVPVADPGGVAVIIFVVLKDAVMLEASIHKWRACHINNCRSTTAELVIRSSDP